MRAFSLFCCIGLVAICLHANHAAAQIKNRENIEHAETAQLNRLVELLNADTYSQRKSAEAQLVQFGPDAIEPLAKALLNSAPQTRAGILCVLKKIENYQDNATTYRAALILESLANSGHTQLQDRATKIAAEWRVSQVKQNIKKLRALGAKINDLDANNNQFARLSMPIVTEAVAFSGTPGETSASTSVRKKTAVPGNDDLAKRLKEIDSLSEAELKSRFLDEIVPAKVERQPASQLVDIADGRRIVIVGGVARIEEVHAPQSRLVSTVTLDENWKGSAEAYQLLRSLPQVPVVNLRNIELRDELLSELGKLPNLHQIIMSDVDFSVPQLCEFMKQHPNIDVNNSSKAFLGVTSVNDRTQRGGCRISSVVDGSAAQKAGIKVDDLIVELADFPVENFADLRLIISTLKPGDKHTIKIRRDQEALSLEITLGEPDEALQPIN